MKYLRIILLIGIFSSCDTFFEFSVYEASVTKENRNTTFKNLELLNNIQVSSQDFKFAFITDTHYFYNNLKIIIDDINKKEDILFVLVGGDITEQGVLKEYQLFYDIIKNLEKPYLTVIGNHDYKSNGGVIYKRMFGDYNYSFKVNNNKFILFDNTVWESNKEPDFDWLSMELNNSKMFNQIFVVAHMPPSTEQFNDDMKETYKSLLYENNVSLSIHGHTHNYFYEKNTVDYLTVPTIKKSTYCIVNVQNESYTIEMIAL
ncbi:metallophosphoesterase [uncultured Polaribacter sp.]|uniref:metallophosphoesterase family protein n=1 Tax=uncultured Polaribacter sp. TaxID=174711 RepID=UPI00262BD67B|nr:metallophosphoesterase [uncultured Polaribacter sp.]